MTEQDWKRQVYFWWQWATAFRLTWSGHVEGSPNDDYDDALDVDPIGWVP